MVLYDSTQRVVQDRIRAYYQKYLPLAQEVTEEVMLRLGRTLHRETGAENLCMAGGVALNCVGNGRILREGPYKGVWIQPAAGDAGGAVGAALAAWHQFDKQPREIYGFDDAMQHLVVFAPVVIHHGTGADLFNRLGSDENPLGWVTEYVP